MAERLTVIGGGLVGSLWALLLRQRGYDVAVYEKRPDPRGSRVEAGRSINLVITSRGLHALKMAGLMEEVTQLAVPVKGRMIHSRDGEQTFQPYGMENEFNLAISRTELNRFLINQAEKAGAVFHFEHELTSADFIQRSLTLTTPSGEVRATYQRVFGTDGAGSVLRREMIRQFPADHVEQVDWLEADYVELLIPRDSGLDVNALHIWPRGAHMMMALANLDDSFTVTLYLPREGEPSFASVVDELSVRRLFENDFKDAIPLMPHFVNEYLQHPRGRLGTVRLKGWTREGSVALLGDAAHAIVPFFGQGMNCGFEDCTEFIRHLEERHPQSEADWAETFAAYEKSRKPNADAIADMALENWIEMRDKVGDPRFLLRKQVEARLEKAFPNLYKSRYGLVAYTLVPYQVAQEVGRAQDRLLGGLCASLTTAEDISLVEAEKLLRSELAPFREILQAGKT